MREKRSEIEGAGVRIVFVHMSSPEEARLFFEKLKVRDCLHLSDPKQELYRAFDLRRAQRMELLTPRSIWMALKTAIFGGHGFGKVAGDENQMPGVFLLHRDQIVKTHQYKELWDHPDFAQFVTR